MLVSDGHVVLDILPIRFNYGGRGASQEGGRDELESRRRRVGGVDALPTPRQTPLGS